MCISHLLDNINDNKRPSFAESAAIRIVGGMYMQSCFSLLLSNKVSRFHTTTLSHVGVSFVGIAIM